MKTAIYLCILFFIGCTNNTKETNNTSKFVEKTKISQHDIIKKQPISYKINSDSIINSIIIYNYLKELNIDILLNEYLYDKNAIKWLRNFYTGNDSASFLKFVNKLKKENKIYDSLCFEREYGWCWWNEGDVYYAPDSTFKIFVLEGHACGHILSPMYNSYIHFKSGRILKPKDYDFYLTTINNLIKTGQNTYLILSYQWCGGSMASTAYKLEQLRILPDTIYSIPLFEDNNTNNYIYDLPFDKFSFEVWGYIYNSDSLNYFTYDSVKQIFYYQYLRDQYEIDEYYKKTLSKISKKLLPIKKDELLVITGEFKIISCKIAKIKEKYNKIKYNKNNR